MRQEISLYLGGTEVQFSEPPEILFSYIRTDYTDPTVLRNSYSKTLTIEGTPNNNQLFNGIYHLDKISDYGTFNPAKRMEFQLFSNGDILEQGYAKLDKINKDGKNINYEITLYGGLGEFLYNLSYDQTAEGSDTSRGGGEDRRLSSLAFYDVNDPNTEFDFDITKDTIAEAWEALEKGTGKTMWQYINFAPAYNGYPQDFDADKVLINTQNSTVPVTYNNNGTTGTSTGFPTSIKQGDQTYRAYNNYAIGQMPKEMTEWEMRDLRSYLQRPVLSMKGFINAISNPVNNGGYEVDLDPAFFNDNNPYYSKAWITLPQLKKDETETGQSAKTQAADNILSVSSYMGESYDVRYYLQGLQPGAVYNGIDLTFSFTTTAAGMPNELYTTAMDYNAGGIFALDAGYFSSIFVQLIGEDENGTPIACSPIYNFTSPYGKEKGFKFLFGNEWEGAQTEYCTRSFFGNDYQPVMEAITLNMLGAFKKGSGNNYTWYNHTGQVSAFTASLTDKLEYHNVYFRVTKVMRWRDYKKNGNPNHNRFEREIFSGLVESEEKRRNILMGWRNDNLVATTGITQTTVVGSQAKYTVVSDVVRSGEHISKGDLLNFDGTPCDYLLSYCKLFNLFLSKDIYDNKIYIRTRDSFYNGGTIDLEQFIDRSKEIKVSPLAMESRWYDFAFPEDEMCGAAEDYDFNYGVEYGKNKVQTTYEFDSSAHNLFEDNIYQNGVQVQESSKYFTVRTARTKTVPTFLYGSIQYELFATPNDNLSSCIILPPSGYTQTGYTSADGKEDWLPKLQLHNDNDPIDGTNVLCFYGGFKSSPYVGGQQAIYYLTDDLAEMYVINGETPCWLWTKTEDNAGTKIAKGMTKLPIFSRMLYDTSGENIEYTWDFGRVRNTYVPVKSYVDKATIYERWWADYVADLYNANTRVVECYVKMEGKVVGEWLRAMYWWDNCYWVLTEINDYNITSYATTKCKFVKVNDITNYTSGITPPGPATPTATLVPETYMIPATGGTINATVRTTDGGSWHLEYPSYVHPSQVAGTGDTQITLQFDANPNNDGREFNIGSYRTVGTNTHFWQEGTESTDQQLSVSGNRLIFDHSAHTYNLATINYRNRGTDTVTISSSADWVTVSQASWNGESAILNVSMGANTGTTVRSATITISANTSHLVTYMYIDQLPQYFTISNNGGSVVGDLINPFSVSALNAFWAEIRTDGDTVTFSAPANTGSTTRYESVLFRVNESGTTAQVRQEGGGGNLYVSPTAITADYTGGDKIMTVQSDASWSVTSKPDWVTLSQSTGGAGQTTVIATLTENTGSTLRTGTITFSDGTRTATVDLTQDYHIVEEYFSANPSSVTWTYVGGTQYINILSSDDWEIYSCPTWVTPTIQSGQSGNTILGLYAPTNPSYDSGKAGNLILSSSTDTLTIYLEQERKEAKSITVSPTDLYYNYSGDTKYAQVSTEISNWFVDSKPEWITLSQVTGPTGDTIVAVTTSQNTSSSIRTGAVVFRDTVYIATLNVSQMATGTTKSLSVSPSPAYAENTGGTVQLVITYLNRFGDDVIITSSENWVVPGNANWSGDTGTVTLNVQNYGEKATRSATITITSVQDATLYQTVTLIQKLPPYIELSPSTMRFDYTGGTATLQLDSSIDWTIDIIDTTE